MDGHPLGNEGQNPAYKPAHRHHHAGRSATEGFVSSDLGKRSAGTLPPVPSDSREIGSILTLLRTG